MRSTLIISLFLLLFSCHTDDGIEGQEADFAMLEIMESEIVSLINIDCTTSSGCKAVAFGSKPCGGPWTYLIYSLDSTNESELLVKVENYNRVQQIINQKYNLISDCAIVLPPDVQCMEGECQTL